MTYMLQNWTCR